MLGIKIIKNTIQYNLIYLPFNFLNESVAFNKYNENMIYNIIINFTKYWALLVSYNKSLCIFSVYCLKKEV